MEVTVKAYLQKADSSVEVRRIPMALEGRQSTTGIFKEMYTKMATSFPGLADKHFSMKWQDPDGDFIMMSSDEEILEALSQAQGSPLKIYISVEGDREISSDEYVAPEEEENGEEEKNETPQSNHQKEDPFADGWPFMGPPGIHMPPGFACHVPPPPPPPHPFGHPMGFLGKMGGMRKRGFPGLHFCPARGGMPGPFRRHGMGQFGGEHSHPFFHAKMMHSGPHHRHHHMGHHGHHHHEEGQPKPGNWKAKLRDAVPVSHRRWAKIYIRNWRVQNLKNATTTSSDSDQGDVTMENASVPDAYARWLDMILPIWHKRWGGENLEEDGNGNAEKEKLKTSVPMEFRKWARWYLARRFGKKEEPKFRAGAGCQRANTSTPCGGVRPMPCHAGGKKEWKKACKMNTIAANIPVQHRRWAKRFIRDWHLEHKVADGKGVVSSESEDTEKEAPPTGAIPVPADYPRWLGKFLARYHLWRGEVEERNIQVEKGGMGEFKDTVPMDFRKWVKCYLWRRHSNRGCQRQEDNASKYQKWLQAFQQKWLKEQSSEGKSDVDVLTSTDDEGAAGVVSSDLDTEGEVESSFKKLRLENSDSPKNVRFDARATENTQRRGHRYQKLDSDNSDTEDASGPFRGKMQPGFRHWAKTALYQWDGKTLNGEEKQNGEQATANPSEEDHIPPNIYNWMSKMMMKMQMKKMKQEVKQAKMAMKAAKKAQKHQHM